MYFINFNIHTELVPSKVYNLDKVDLIVYPSHTKLQESSSKYYRPTTMTGVIIKGNKEFLTSENITKRINDFIVFSNFIFPCYVSVLWLKNYSFQELEKQLRPLEELQDFLKDNLETDITLIDSRYKDHEFYEFTSLFAHLNHRELTINFHDLLAAYCSINETNKLKHQISLFALNSGIIAILSPFYDNGNLPISLMYSIVDSLMKDHITDTKAIKVCKNCGFKTEGTKKHSILIKDFVSKLKYSDNDKQLLCRILWEHYKIRNDFFHDVTLKAYAEPLDEINRILSITGREFFTLEDDIIYREARNSGYMIIKELVQFLLLEKLHIIAY